MKYIVTHTSPDLDAITSVWLIKRYLPGWEHAEVLFVPAGQKLDRDYHESGDAIEAFDDNEVIHVDTGMGKLDHHQTDNAKVCAASLTFDYVSAHSPDNLQADTLRLESVRRMVEIAVAIDHFQEVFFADATSLYYDFSVIALIDGLKMQYPGDDIKCAEIVMQNLDAVQHTFAHRIQAEKEIDEEKIEFDTKWGKAIAMETHNDNVLKLAQKMGYVVAVRKDPSSGSIRIKGRPPYVGDKPHSSIENPTLAIDFTPVYKILKERDPQATWFLHSSKRMLLNGSSKNPEMRGSTIPLQDVIQILQELQ